MPSVKRFDVNNVCVVWITFPPGMDAGPSGRLLASALEEGVLNVPGEYGYSPEGGPVPRNEARLSFGVASPEQIREGVRRLRRAVATVAGRDRASVRPALV